MHVTVQFPEKYAPDSEALAQAIADFASALATGDASAFSDMLSEEDRGLLRADLVPSGRWAESTSEVNAIRIVNLEDGESIARVAIAIGTGNEAYLTAWSARRLSGDQWQFTAMPVARRTTTRVALLDDEGFHNDVFVGLFMSQPEESVPPPAEDQNDDFGSGDDFSIPPTQPSTPVTPGIR
jgi:hypothetical protein